MDEDPEVLKQIAQRARRKMLDGRSTEAIVLGDPEDEKFQEEGTSARAKLLALLSGPAPMDDTRRNP